MAADSIELPRPRSSRTLYAFYDLAANPNSFDISKYLVLADLDRRGRGLDEMHVVIVPDATGWARGDDEHPRYHQEWRLRHILLPAMALMPSVTGYTVCTSREEASRIELSLCADVFPEGHTTDAPVARFEWADLACVADKGIPSLRATEQARRYARNWMRERANGRKVVSLTFREMDQQSHRNNDTGAWLDFVRGLDSQIYFPVVIRDTEYALEVPKGPYSGIQMFPEAALDLELRAGFYEECYLNLFSPNGPAEISLLNTRIAYLFFMKIRTANSNGIRQDAPEFGIPLRGEFPVYGPHQHIVWDGDSLASMSRDFAAMVERIDYHRVAIETFRQRSTFPPSEVRGLTLCELLVRGGKWQHAEMLIAKLVATGAISAARAAYFRGRSRLHTHLLDEAISHLEEAVRLDPGEAEYPYVLAQLFVKSGRVDEAVRYYRASAILMPDPIEADIALAMILDYQGKYEEAETFIRKYLDFGRANPQLLRVYASVRRNTGHFKEAVELELRAAAWRRATTGF